MENAAKQYHYSALHWARQFTAIDKHIDDISRRHSRACGLLRSSAASPFEAKRLRELRESAGDMLKIAHINKYKMLNDPLRINDISFGVMLDDTKKDLHHNIDQIYFKIKLEGLIDELIAKIVRAEPKPRPYYDLGTGLNHAIIDEFTHDIDNVAGTAADYALLKFRGPYIQIDAKDYFAMLKNLDAT